MRLKFTKMQGAGNDFVVIDAVRQRVNFSAQQRRRVADRHFGVGADQMLLVERSNRAGVDFKYRIFNADGGEVQHCGNGARCFVHFVRDQGLTDKKTIRVDTLSGVLELRLHNDGQVSVDMGEPIFDPPKIPFDPTWLATESVGDDRVYTLLLNGRSWRLSAISVGNPHAVIQVADVDAAAVLMDGALLERHPAFPQRVNVGFMQVLAQHAIKLRVFERGVGETLACGTGACAAAVIALRRQLVSSPVQVHARGGVLTVQWDSSRILMTGPAESVFDGEIDLDDAP